MRSWSRARAPLCALAAAFGLAACGGGGGGHRGSAPIEVPHGARVEEASSGSNVSSRNFVDLAGPLVRLVASSSGNPVRGSVEGRNSALAAGTPAASPTAAAGAGLSLLRRSMRALSRQEQRAGALALTTDVRSCPGGGSQTITTDDADRDGYPSPGESVTIEFRDCRIDSLALPADGRFTFTFDDIDLLVSGDGRFEVVGVVAFGEFDRLSVDGLASLDGAFEIWWTVDKRGREDYRVSYANVRASVSRQEQFVYDFDIEGEATGSTGDFAIDGALGIAGQRYKVVQGSTWFGSSGSALPDRGDLYLQDDRGDSLGMVVVGDDTIDLVFIPAGAQQPTVVAPDWSWADFGV